MRIGIDIDNTLTDIEDELENAVKIYAKSLGKSEIADYIDLVDNNDGNIYQARFDFTYDELKYFLKDIQENITINALPRKDVVESIAYLRKKGNKIYIITARDSEFHDNPYKLSKEWLDKNNLEYDKLIVDARDKAKVCLEEKIDIFIDDSLSNCINVSNVGIKTIRISKDTEKQNDFVTLDNWNSIYEYINNLGEGYEFINEFHTEKLNVILDTDTYNECDDQFALAYMLKNQDIFNVEAITIAPYINKQCTIPEGQENSYNEVLKICNWLDFNTKNKVFKGSMDFMINGYDKDNDAVNKIIEIALKNNKTYIMAIGAITNLALAIKKEPKIVDRIEVIWLGGHSFLQGNNIETNFKDRKAVKIVFDSKVKLTVIPAKSVSSNLRTSIYELEHFLKGKSELCDYLCQIFYNDGYHGIKESRVIWDISVIAYLINKSWFEVSEISCPNIRDDSSYEMTEGKHIITMVNFMNVNKIFTDLFKKLG